MSDEIIKKVRRTKDRLANQYNFDLDALAGDLRKLQKQTKRKVVNLARKTTRRTNDNKQDLRCLRAAVRAEKNPHGKFG